MVLCQRRQHGNQAILFGFVHSAVPSYHSFYRTGANRTERHLPFAANNIQSQQYQFLHNRQKYKFRFRLSHLCYSRTGTLGEPPSSGRNGKTSYICRLSASSYQPQQRQRYSCKREPATLCKGARNCSCTLRSCNCGWASTTGLCSLLQGKFILFGR